MIGAMPLHEGIRVVDVQVLVRLNSALIHHCRPEGYLDTSISLGLEYLGVTLEPKVAGWN